MEIKIEKDHIIVRNPKLLLHADSCPVEGDCKNNGINQHLSLFVTWYNIESFFFGVCVSLINPRGLVMRRSSFHSDTSNIKKPFILRCWCLVLYFSSRPSSFATSLLRILSL
jgi:hypothetical protein